jgi:CBS domain-containing protein
MFTARDLMTPNPIAVSAAARVSEAVQIFQTLDIRHLPVVNEVHELIGVLSDRDLRALSIPDLVDSEWIGVIQTALDARVATLMSSSTVSVDLDTEASEITELMLEHRIGAVPVVDGDGRLAGIVSYVDLLRAFSFGNSGAEAAQ